MLLGENILKLRKQNGLSQEQLGEQIDVTRQTISNWELGETSPNPEQLKQLSKVFNISIDELLDNEAKEILMEKVSNTEKLAGIIIKILKVIGILILIYFIFLIIIAVVGFFFYSSNKKVRTTVESSTVRISEESNSIDEIDLTSKNNLFL